MSATATTGLVLAAGGGLRFGGIKQLADVDGRPLVEHAIRALAATPAIDPIVVVLGAHAGEIEARVDFHGARRVVCADWAAGMSASLRCGLAAAGDTGEVVVVLADQPFITAAAIQRVLATPGAAARAVYGGVPGHPVVLRGPVLARAGELRGDSGFRDLLAGAAQVECGDVADARDIDTREDLEVVRR